MTETFRWGWSSQLRKKKIACFANQLGGGGLPCRERTGGDRGGVGRAQGQPASYSGLAARLGLQCAQAPCLPTLPCCTRPLAARRESYDRATALWGLIWRVVGSLVAPRRTGIFWVSTPEPGTPAGCVRPQLVCADVCAHPGGQHSLCCFAVRLAPFFSPHRPQGAHQRFYRQVGPAAAHRWPKPEWGTT